MERAVIDSIVEQLGNADQKDRYYVYALCEEKEGNLIPFYIGKGQGNRVWQHEEETEAEKKLILDTIKDESEKGRALDDVSEKHKRINDIGAGNVKKIIIKYGLTENEAFAAESALINICQLKGLTYKETQNRITNKANGHASNREKNSLLAKSMAMTVEEFHTNCCYDIVQFEELQEKRIGKRIIFININQYYPRCLELPDCPGKNGKEWAIMESSRGTWGVSDNKEVPDYLFTLYRNKICGIFKIEGIHSFADGEDYPVFPKEERDAEKAIIESMKTHKEGNTLKYGKLSDETRKAFEEFINDYHISAGRRSKAGEKINYEDEFKKFTNRKYFSCNTLSEDDQMKKYLGRIVTNEGKSIMGQKGFRYNYH